MDLGKGPQVANCVRVGALIGTVAASAKLIDSGRPLQSRFDWWTLDDPSASAESSLDAKVAIPVGAGADPFFIWSLAAFYLPATVPPCHRYR